MGKGKSIGEGKGKWTRDEKETGTGEEKEKGTSGRERRRRRRKQRRQSNCPPVPFQNQVPLHLMMSPKFLPLCLCLILPQNYHHHRHHLWHHHFQLQDFYHPSWNVCHFLSLHHCLEFQDSPQTFLLSYLFGFSQFSICCTKKVNACLQENKRTRNYNNHYYILYTLYIKCPKNIAILRKEHEENLTKNSLQQVLHISTEFTLQERKK